MSVDHAWPEASWDQLRDVTTAGFSPTGLERVAAAARPLATTALMVVAGGRVVLQYGDIAEITHQASVRKSLGGAEVRSVPARTSGSMWSSPTPA